jgi:hypothetical protein
MRLLNALRFIAVAHVLGCQGQPQMGTPSASATSSSKPNCDPGAITCASTRSLRLCTANGQWRELPCPNACVKGECVGSCVPGKSTCRDERVVRCSDEGKPVDAEICGDFDECREGSCARRLGTFWTKGDAYDLGGSMFGEICTSMYHSAGMQMSVRSADDHFVAAYSGKELVVMNMKKCCAPPEPEKSKMSSETMRDCPWAVVAKFFVGQRKALAWSPSGDLLAVATHHGSETNPSSTIQVYSMAKKGQIQRLQVSGLYVHQIAFVDEYDLLVSDNEPRENQPRKIPLNGAAEARP